MWKVLDYSQWQRDSRPQRETDLMKYPLLVLAADQMLVHELCLTFVELVKHRLPLGRPVHKRDQ